MEKEKIKKKIAELFNVNPQLTNASFDIFIQKLAEELSSGEAFSIPGLGIFQKKNDNVLHFIDPLQEENDKLFVKIEVPQTVQKQFDLDETELDGGVGSDVIDLTDENQLTELETLETEINEKIKTFEKLKDFDPYALITSEEVESQETEAEISAEFEGENIHEAANELDEDLQKELEEQLLEEIEDDLKAEISENSNETKDELEEEPNEETPQEETEIPGNERQDAAYENGENTNKENEEEINELEETIEEEKIEEKEEEVKETREDDFMSEEELQNAFDDLDDEPSEEEERKNEEEKDKDEEGSNKKGKKKSLFSFLKKGKKKNKKDKKEKKSKKEKKKKDKSKEKEQKKEKDENGEGEEGKKKISKKLLIILIAVFVLITAGGVYYFFFMGEETHEEQVSEEHGKQKHEAEGEHGGGHGGEHGKESIEDSLRRHRKHPLTPEEIGETKEAEAKYSVDINQPEKSTNETYLLPPEADLEDPLITKEFPNEKRITHTIYENDGKYMVQISSWKRSSRARKIVYKLRRAGYNAFIVKAYLPALGGTWYRVSIGFFNTLKDAEEFIKKKKYFHVR